MIDDTQTPPTAEPWRRAALRWVERGLWAISAACILWVAGSWADARAYQARAARELERQAIPAVAETVAGPTADASATQAPPGELPIEDHRAAADDPAAPAADVASRPGRPLAQIRVPSVGLEAVVAEGTGGRTLQRAVGHLEGSSMPGESGHVVLAGHRDTFFRPLEHIEPGDEVVLESPAGSHRYTVEWMRIVEPTSTGVLRDPGYPALTLVTCYPFRFVGSAPLRYVVRARRLS